MSGEALNLHTLLEQHIVGALLREMKDTIQVDQQRFHVCVRFSDPVTIRLEPMGEPNKVLAEIVLARRENTHTVCVERRGHQNYRAYLKSITSVWESGRSRKDALARFLESHPEMKDAPVEDVS